jgi:uncharacterized SAM-binding protein YcdF (DUF218 family)
MVTPSRSRVRHRDPNVLIAIILLGALAFGVLHVMSRTTTTSSSSSSSKSNRSNTGDIYNRTSDVMSQKFDAILVLGGGVPSSLYEPPIYVKQRCDDAAAIRGTTETPILTLSAGTAHLPQLLSKDGLPVWESTSSAAYLQQRHNIHSNLYMETTSYDTIGNAFFARTSHTDIVHWRKLLVVTSEVR